MKNRKPTIKSLQRRVKELEKKNQELELQLQKNAQLCCDVLQFSKDRQDRARRMVEHFKEYSTTLLTTM